MTELKVYIKSLKSLYDTPMFGWNYSALMGRDFYDNLSSQNFPQLTDIDVEQMFDSIVKHWNKTHPETLVRFDKSEIENTDSFWLFLLEIAGQIKSTYLSAANLEELEDKISSMEKSIECLETAKNLIGPSVSRIHEYQYYIDLKLPCNQGLGNLEIFESNKNNSRLFKLDIFQILEVNSLKLKEDLKGVIHATNSWNELAKNKSGKTLDEFGIRLAIGKCGKLMQEAFGLQLYRTTARLVSVSLGKPVSESRTREVLRQR